MMWLPYGVINYNNTTSEPPFLHDSEAKGSERVPYGSKRPYIGVKWPHGSQHRPNDDGQNFFDRSARKLIRSLLPLS